MRKLMRERREELNLSQQYVADHAGLTRVNYSSIERGRTEPNIKQMISIAKVLNVKPNANFFKDYCYKTDQSKEKII